MRSILADTSYWIAIINPKDQLHDRAMAAGRQFEPFRLITSDMILVEVLNGFAQWGEHIRRTAVGGIQDITQDTATEVIPQSRRLFQEAFELYRRRPDKSWSLTDCASFVIMDKHNIAEALTQDVHFMQKGYAALLR